MTVRSTAAAPHLIRPSRLTPRSFEERGALPIRLAATLSREFTRGILSAAPADYSALHRSLGDLTGLYGADYRPDLLDPDRLVSYKYMASELLGELGPLLGEVDLVILAYATPEIDTRDFVGCFLADAVPGGPLVFSISDQGPTAPFTALRLAGDYLEDCAGRRALVLALDQHTIPWDVPDRAALPTCNAAVAVVVDHVDAARDGGSHASEAAAADRGTQVLQYASAAPEDVGATVEEALASARLRFGRAAVLVAGRDTPLSQASVASAAAVFVADRGRVCTGVWHALDDHRLNHPDGTGPVVVVDYDPVWRYLGVAVFDGAGR
jgi:hypothetical protein